MAHGQYVDGVWKTEWHDTKSTGGRFKRTEPKFRNWVTPDGSAAQFFSPAMLGGPRCGVALPVSYPHLVALHSDYDSLRGFG